MNNKRVLIVLAALVLIGIFGFKLGIFPGGPKLDTNPNNATTTPNVGGLSDKEQFKQTPLYQITSSPLSKKYKNSEIGFSIMLPDKVIVKTGGTYFNSDSSLNKIVIDDAGYEGSVTDLWAFYSENKNPARNRNAKSLSDYTKDYPAPDVKNHIVVIHKSENINSYTIRQEYSFGSMQAGQFVAGTSGCDACYSANRYVRYVYWNSKTSSAFILERMPLAGEFYQNSIAYREKEALAERIAKTFVFE
jgi:hypothetical protein